METETLLHLNTLIARHSPVLLHSVEQVHALEFPSAVGEGLFVHPDNDHLHPAYSNKIGKVPLKSLNIYDCKEFSHLKNLKPSHNTRVELQPDLIATSRDQTLRKTSTMAP